MARANRALGALRQGSSLIPNPGILRAPTLRREAQSTSALEGTFAPLDEVLAAEAVGKASRSPALSEVLNYIDTAELGFAWVQERRVTTGLLEELQSVLVRGTAADTQQAGHIRTVPVAIGTRGGGIEDARFVPMPPGTPLRSAVDDLLDWVDAAPRQDLDPVVAAALTHYQFETLHPFNDGNGRLGRLLIVLQLMRSDVLTEPLLSVSPWFEARRDQYQDALAAVSAEGAWDEWVALFADGIHSSAVDTGSRMSDLLAVQAEYRDRIRASGARGMVLDVAEYLIGAPFVTVPMLASALGKTYQAASNAVARLVELEILTEVERQGVRVFRASNVVQVTMRPGAGSADPVR
ncbi:Fic/DOC family N-terminal domain-containing protein [Curtobacterium sp. MCPF17_002]|uniref:Fic family protein n=1 Tax=Curtobacterium sp. MCPF17_002 TaxID=2175645 RepID=UPI0015E8A261|nr:Fic/DOC family N-terminal domain-containing protein [Curtobacterium sp. MCPF17_002]WIB77401.1 Fic/DOC family N-terminal domain-containing protein [Curtobacterium sp. MCPF17_002]